MWSLWWEVGAKPAPKGRLVLSLRVDQPSASQTQFLDARMAPSVAFWSTLKPFVVGVQGDAAVAAGRLQGAGAVGRVFTQPPAGMP